MTPERHPASIYENQPGDRFYSPFSLEVDPMERLLLVTFERDPDEVYRALEVQVFDDPVNGRGLLVIAARHDRKVDVYHQPGLSIEHKNFDIVEKGLGGLFERPLEGARYEVQDKGVNVELAFKDKQGRTVAVRVRETSRKPRKPFALLAPLGSGSENPSTLPLVLLYDFYFVRRAGTDLEIKFDGQSRQPDMLPGLVDGSRMTFIRHSPDPFILKWNENYDGSLAPLLPFDVGAFAHKGVIYHLSDHAGFFEIRGMRLEKAKHDVRFTFNPPFPDVSGLKDGARANGVFTIWMRESMGRVEGVYAVRRKGNLVEIEIHPSGGWRPAVRKWSIRFIFLVAPIFKNWPKTYKWTAKIDFSQVNLPSMKSSWRRIGDG